MPNGIVSNKDVEIKSLESFSFVYGLNDTFKSDIDNFMKIEVHLGLLKHRISHDQLFWDGK